jgi:hypothetical protein
MLLSCHQSLGQNQDIKIANRSFENVSQFRYLGMTLTNQIMVQEECGNACCHSVQNLLSSHLLSRNMNVILYKTIIFPLILYDTKGGT